MPNQHINQIQLISAITTHLQKKQGVKNMLPREFNKIISCVNEIIREFKSPERIITPNMGYQNWINSDHTGLSSLYLAKLLTSQTVTERESNFPHDAEDFDRCLKLLIAVPELKNNLHFLKNSTAEWKEIYNNWDYLESLMNAKKFKTVNEFLGKF